jgi:hypothetical protein
VVEDSIGFGRMNQGGYFTYGIMGCRDLLVKKIYETGKEGIRKYLLRQKNGSAINIKDIKEHAVVDCEPPLITNAYSNGNQNSPFLP